MISTVGRHIAARAQLTDHAQYLSGIPASRYYADPRMMVDVQLTVAEYYGLTAAMSHNVFYDVYNVELEALGQRLLYHDTGMPEVDQAEPLIRTPGDLDRLRMPDPQRDGRIPVIVELNRYVRDKTGSPAGVLFCAPFSLAVLLRGYSNLVRDIKRDPSFAHQILSTITDRVLIPYVDLLLQTAGPGGDATGADAWGSVPNVSLAMIEEFVAPYAVRLRDRLGNVATCGWWGESQIKDPQRLLELKLLASGSVYGYDPDVGRLGPRLWKDFAVAHGCPLVLGVDARLIRDGPPEAIIDRVRDYLSVGDPGHGLELFVNNVPADTPSSHVHAFVAAASAYGAMAATDFDSAPVIVPDREPFFEFAARRGIPARLPAI